MCRQNAGSAGRVVASLVFDDDAKERRESAGGVLSVSLQIGVEMCVAPTDSNRPVRRAATETSLEVGVS